jgi:hypothetical protein
MERWRIIALIILLSVGFYSFVKFLPIELKKSDKDFFKDCCEHSICNLNYLCDIYLKNWIQESNLSRSLIDECCYWYASYNKKVLPFCNPYCLKNR